MFPCTDVRGEWKFTQFVNLPTPFGFTNKQTHHISHLILLQLNIINMEKMYTIIKFLKDWYKFLILSKQMSHVMRKPIFAICKPQRQQRSTCAFAQSDQRIWRHRLQDSIMHNSFVIIAHPPLFHLRGWARDSGANVWGSDLLSSPAVPGKCPACDITQIYPHGIYYNKEQSYDSQQIPAVQGSAFSRAMMDEKLSSLLFPVGGWGGGGQWLQMTVA